MLKIYGADLSTPANKVRMAVNALGLDHEYIRVSIRDGENRRPEFLKINPVAKIPVIDDGGFVLFESGAICRYLAGKVGSDLYPADLKQRAVVNQWVDFAAIHIIGAMSKVVFNRIFYKMAKAELDERSLQDGLNFLKRFLPVADDQLGKNAFLAGEKMTLADITLLSGLDPCEVAQIDLAPYKNIVKWRSALQKKDFYQKCYKEYGEPLKKMAPAH